MGILDAIQDVLNGVTDTATLGGTGPFVAYVERLSDQKRWLVAAVLGAGGTFPSLDLSFVDLSGDGTADLSVQVGVSFALSLSTPAIDRAKVRIRRQTSTTRMLPPFRLVIRADGSAVMPADDASTNDISFVFVEFDDPSGSVDVPDELAITAAPKGLDSSDSSTWVQRGCATTPWPRDSSEPDGQQFDVQVEVTDGSVPTRFTAGLIVDGQSYTPSSPSDMMIASPTKTPYAPTPVGTEDATIAATQGAASELRHFDISLKEAGATSGTTDVTVDTCLWRELVAGSSPGLLDTQVAMSLDNSKRTDLDVNVTSRDSSGTSTVDVHLADLPTAVHARALPSRRAPQPGSTGADGQDAWIGYNANGSLGEFKLDASPAGAEPLWLFASDLPRRIGFTQAGVLEDTFVVRGGDPNDLSTAMPSGFGRLAVELGPDRNGPPGSGVEVRETVSGSDTTWRFAVPGLDRFEVTLDPPPAGGGGSEMLDRRIEAFYHLSGAPDPLDATIDTETITGDATGLPHEVTSVLEPDHRSTTADDDEPWLDYRADRTLEHLELDVQGAIWLWLEAVPTAVGFTHAGEFADEAFAVELGAPNDLTQPLPSPIDRVALELGPARRGAPSDELDIYQTVADSDTTWRLAVPGLDFASVDVESPPSADAGLLDRELNAHASLGGADPPIAGTLHLEDVAGFAGDGTIASFPPDVTVSHVPDGSGGHELVVDVDDERLGALEAALRREPTSAPDDLPYHRGDARVRRLPSLRAEWAETSDGSLANAHIGDIDDLSEPVDGGLGEVTAALDADPDADPVLAPEPRLRFEQAVLADDTRLLVGAADLGRAGFEAIPDGVEVEVVRAMHSVHMGSVSAMRHERQQSDYSFAVERTVESDGTPTRTLVHGGNLHHRLKATVTTPDDEVRLTTDGVVDRLKALHMVKPAGALAWDADGLRADVSLPRLPEEMDVSIGEATTIELPSAVRATVGLRDPEGIASGQDQHVNASVSLPEGRTTLTTTSETTPDITRSTVSVEAGEGHGLTGRVALSRALDDLAAVRATPQAYDHKDTKSDGSSEPVATTARVYGLRNFTVESTSFTRDAPGLLAPGSNLDLDAALAPSRPNTSFRISTFGADAPGREPRPQSRVRLADIANRLSVRTRDGDEPWQTRVEAASPVGPLADEGDVWAEPAQVPWDEDGPATGELVGVGLVEAVLESLPAELVLVGLPFEEEPGRADPSGRAGFLATPSGFHGGGQLIEVTGSLRIRDMLQLGWARGRGGEDKWSRSDIACLQVEADDGGQFWLRQLEKRDAPLDDSETKLNIMVDPSVRVSMAVDNYDHDTTRGSEPSNWRDFSGSWSPSAKLQLKNFAGWVQIDPAQAGIGTLFSPVVDDVRSGNWWVRQVGGWAGDIDLPGDVSLGSTSGTTFDKNPIDDVCGGDG